jgi:hypothetical protein
MPKYWHHFVPLSSIDATAWREAAGVDVARGCRIRAFCSLGIDGFRASGSSGVFEKGYTVRLMATRLYFASRSAAGNRKMDYFWKSS